MTPDNALTVKQAHDQLALGLTGRMRVKGFVVALEDCNTCGDTQTCSGCQLSHFEIGDTRFADPVEQLMVATFPNGQMPKLTPGEYVVVDGTAVVEFSKHVQHVTGHGLRFSRYAPATAPTSTLEPTYADGSWSVGDLRKRTDLSQGDVVSVTGTVVQVYACPPCPPKAVCKPCIGNHLVVDDGLLVGGVDEVLKRRGSFVEGRRYVITGTLAYDLGPLKPLHGPALWYTSHRPAK